MSRYIPHAQRIIDRAVADIFAADLTDAATVTGMLRGYLSALDAIGAEL